MKIKGMRIDLCLIILLMLDVFFDFKIVIDLSSSNRKHLYDVYLFEILAILLFFNLIYNYKKIIHILPAKGMFITIILFWVYYVTLFVVRMITHNNYASSMMLFRLFSSVAIYTICMILNQDKLSIFKNSIRTLLIVLNVGYLIASIKENYMAPRFFAQFPSTYMTVVTISIPLCFLFLAKRERNWLLFIIDSVNLGIMCIFGCFSGSRVVFIIWSTECVILSAIILFKRFKIIGMEFVGIGVGLFILFVCDFNFCQASISRSLDFASYKINLTDNEVKDVADITKYESSDVVTVDEVKNEDSDVVTADEVKHEDFDTVTVEEVNKDVNYHNPTAMSNAIRKELLIGAVERLKNDWLFSLKGNTELPYSMGNGKQAVSGTHNALLDYALAFGGMGVIIIAIYFLYMIFYVGRTLAQNKSWIEFTVCIEILFAMGGMGFTQAVGSTRLSLMLFCTYIALIYINEGRETNETGLIKKGNDLHC